MSQQPRLVAWMPSVPSHGMNNLPASCTSLLSAWASQGITILQYLRLNSVTPVYHTNRVSANIWTQLYLSKEVQFWYFPWGILQNTHKAVTFMVMLQQMQQSEGPKVQAWTWVPIYRAHNNSIISRCREHTLTMFPGICLSAYCIEQIQRVTSQASSHTLPCWLETRE